MPALARLRPLSRPALVLVVAAALAGCGGGEDPEPGSRAPVLVRPSLPQVASGVTQDGVPLLVNVGYSEGSVTGASRSVSLRQNTPVRVTVISDKTDKVLVRGYEVREQLAVGQPVQVAFIADRVGTFEIVPEDTGTVLTRVVVG